MRKFNKILFLLLLFVSTSALAQQVTDLRLNEILIKNETNYMDEYGRRMPWIEIFNTSYNFVNLGGCYLTDDTTGLSDGSGVANWYRIPTGDPKLNIPQRSYVVFFLDNCPLYGTFHTNFNPLYSKTNYVALINSNGKTVVDVMNYPASLRQSDLTFGCKLDGKSYIEDKKGEEVKNTGFLDHFTPGSTNEVKVLETKNEKLEKDDPYGIGLAIISMAVVFSVLILIYCMLKVFGVLSRKKLKKNTADTNASFKPDSVSSTKENITGEEVAAIAMALHYHQNSFHDEESEVITIETPSAHYSPWSQKHLTIRRVERRG